jgi:hypothetical protein
MATRGQLRGSGACVVSMAMAMACGALVGCENATAPPDAGSIDATVGDDGSAVGCAEPGSVERHGPCACTTDCGEGTVCALENVTGIARGECVATCETGVVECLAGERCELVDGAVGFCHPECTASADCREGRVCHEGRCFWHCTADSQCSSGHCNPYNGRCYDGAPLTGAGVREACLRHEDCRSGTCVEGTCVTSCVRGIETCPDDAACVLDDDPTRGLGVCLRRCESSETCPDAWECVLVPSPRDARVCLPVSTGPDCHGRVGIVTEGGPCGCGNDCTFESRCVSEDAGALEPGGICVRACTLPEGERLGPGDACGTGFVCADHIDVPDEDGGGACIPTCAGPEDCHESRICSATRGCVAHCQDDAQCEFGTCNLYRGWCTDVRTDRAPIGELCMSVTACRGICLRPDDRTMPGMCSAQCSRALQRCPDGALCVDDGDGDYGHCAPPCVDDTECPITGMICSPEPEPGLGRYCTFAPTP